MNIHKNARLTPLGRGEMVRRVLAGERVSQVAAAFSTTAKTVSKWVDRFSKEDLEGLKDRSSRPHRLRRPTPAQTVERVIRYEYGRSGGLIHIDIKKLGRFDQVGHRITGDKSGQKRGAGWEFVHVCIDAASRAAFSQVMPDERKDSAVPFLKAAVAYYRSLGVTGLGHPESELRHLDTVVQRHGHVGVEQRHGHESLQSDGRPR